MQARQIESRHRELSVDRGLGDDFLTNRHHCSEKDVRSNALVFVVALMRGINFYPRTCEQSEPLMKKLVNETVLILRYRR